MRPLRFELMADDVAALMALLKIEKADVLGYSLGGGVALQTAIRHPAAVNRLIVVSTAMQRGRILSGGECSVRSDGRARPADCAKH